MAKPNGGKGRSVGEGTVRWRKDGTCEARLLVPKETRQALGLTLDTYAHVLPHMQAEAFGRFGTRLSGSSEGGGVVASVVGAGRGAR